MNEKFVEQNAAAVLERHPELRTQSLAEAVEPIVNDSKRGRAVKFFRLVQLADATMEKIAPNAPCRKGCNHCCHMHTVITKHEAGRIAAFTGRSIAQTASYQGNAETTEVERAASLKRYNGVPCTFLAPDGSCSVYSVRPLICRTYHSLEETAEPCDVIKHPGGKVGQFNMNPINWAPAWIFGLNEPCADIREFFP